MKIEVSNGEIVDKITILKIKKEKITDEIKLKNVTHELNELLPKLSVIGIDEDHSLFEELLQVNRKLWDIEDELRNLERIKNFGNEFIELARSVYYTNDQRFNLKREINAITNSHIIEEKSYQEY
jgi:type II secretory pathway predicted ATPase ExeA